MFWDCGTMIPSVCIIELPWQQAIYRYGDNSLTTKVSDNNGGTPWQGRQLPDNDGISLTTKEIRWRRRTMAGFFTTYHRINYMNIRHLYSEYKEPIIHRKRVPNRIVAVREHDKLERRKLMFSVDKRCNEYVTELRISLPRAPAFRMADKEQIDEIVQRLTRPKTADLSPRRERMLAREEEESRRCKSAASAITQRTGSGSVSRCSQDIDLIFKRLHYTHTYVSKQRMCNTARLRHAYIMG